MSTTSANAGVAVTPKGVVYKGVADYLKQASPALSDLYHTLDAFLVALGEVQVNFTKQYVAYRRIKNFACVEVHPHSRNLLVYVKVNPDSIQLEPGFTRDVRRIGHFGTGDLEITLTSVADLEKSKDLLVRSYDAS